MIVGVELGFERVEVSDSESQNGYDYYYYILDLLPGLSLVSSANDESTESWKVYNFNWDTKNPLDIPSINNLIEVAVNQGYKRN